MSKSAYEPRPGSKVALAFDALLDGPMVPAALAKVMEVPDKVVTALLTHPIKRGSLVKLKDASGRLHYARPDAPIDARFTPIVKGDAEKPAAKFAANKPAAVKVFNPSDPFGLADKAATRRKSAPGKPAAAPASTIYIDGRPEKKPDAPAFPSAPTITVPVFGSPARENSPPATPSGTKQATPAPTELSGLAGAFAETFKATLELTCQPAGDAPFSAGLFSNGELVIKAGPQSITLSSAHTRQLVNYIHQFKESA